MKVIALLSWYDESPSWLAATVASLKGFASELVALDGAYAYFPRGRARSGAEQAEIIVETAHAAGIGLVLVRPSTVWATEVVKRNAGVQHALQLADPGDWLLRIDADEVITRVPADALARLDETDRPVAEVTLWTREDLSVDVARALPLPSETSCRARFLYRLTPGLHVAGQHYRYMVGGARLDKGTSAYDLSDLKIEHRHRLRPLSRTASAKEYNRIRNELGIETPEV